MSRIRNPDWENDENLKADMQKYVLQNLTRREVLDFLGRYYRKIHYLTREFRVKLHVKTDIARIAKR